MSPGPAGGGSLLLSVTVPPIRTLSSAILGCSLMSWNLGDREDQGSRVAARRTSTRQKRSEHASFLVSWSEEVWSHQDPSAAQAINLTAIP